jgi:MATE family multidrug resistance protein
MTLEAAPLSAPKASLRALLALAWPVVLARATQSVIGFTDALMVSPLGEEPLAAVTTGALNTFALIVLPLGAAFIVQSFAAQLRGRGDLAAVPRYAFYGLGLALLAGVFAAACIPLVSPALGLLHYAPRVHSLMSEYIAIRLLSVAPAIGMEALGNWYGGLGNTRPGLVASLVAMVVNVLGCYALIEPRFGLPGYGVAGSAWASVAGCWLGFAVIALAFFNPRERVWRCIKELHLSEFTRMLRFGVPNGVNWFLEFSAFALFLNVVVAHLGTTVLAAFMVVMQINSISFMPTFGLSSSGAIMVGEAIGRRAHDEVWPIVRLTGQVACGWMGSVALLYLMEASWLMRLFQPRDIEAEALMTVGTTMLALSAIWQLFDAVGITLSETLRAAGDTAWCMGARIVLAWVVFMPFAWLSVVMFHGGVNYVIAAMVVYLALLSVVFALRFASGKWRNIDLVGAEPSLV